MTGLHYETQYAPSPEQLAAIDRGLHDYNVGHLGEGVTGNYHRVVIMARNGDGTLVGGVHGEMVWEWLHVDTLWVDAAHRGTGIGSELLARLEAEAVANGFYGAHLETTSFQALEFYRRHGYEVFGELLGKPKGVTWYYLKKVLGVGAP